MNPAIENASTPSEGFDEYAEGYDAALNRGLAVSGESKDFFAQSRVAMLTKLFATRGFVPKRVLDFGCGTGSATPHLRRMPGVEQIVGADISVESLRVAQREHGGGDAEFVTTDRLDTQPKFDLAYTTGVFHHIPPDQRANAVASVYRALRPGGLFSFWENNPWNPGTRLIMSRIPFDHDAITLSPPESRQMLRAAGFRVVRFRSAFFFPRVLSALRFMEPCLGLTPLGAQYHVLAMKP